MAQTRYRIFELSARAVMSYAAQEDGRYRFALDQASTERCKSRTALHEQDSNALFFQIMCVLHGDSFDEPREDALITGLSDVIFYMDFSGIFDRSSLRDIQRLRQEKARDMFRPEGVCLDFGSGQHRYLAFERSGNMSRQAKLSFLREDVYHQVRRRIQMDMDIGDCQLSKLYAYNGLMLSGGVRVDGIGIDRPHRVVVIDNPTREAHNVPIITVEDDGSLGNTRRYHRVERREEITVTCFDGEGLISKEYAKVVDRAFCGEAIHTSFQIRLPYIKGMLHQVDFHDFLLSCGTDTIVDMWGVAHPVREVDVILTRSMFKGCGWLKNSGMTWEDYWLGGLLVGLPPLPPRPVHHQREQGKAPGPHRPELSVLKHGLHPGGGVPALGSAGRLGSQSGRGRAELAHQADGAGLLQLPGQPHLPAGLFPPGTGAHGHLLPPPEPGAAAGRAPEEKSKADRRAGLPGCAGREGKADPEALRSWTAHCGGG